MVLDAACRSLRGLEFDDFLDRPAESRLAIRELGLAIGLAAIDPIERFARARPLASGRLESLDACLAVLRDALGRRNEICYFWCESGHRREASWTDHADINDVMLATSLIPEGWVVLAAPVSVSPSA